MSPIGRVISDAVSESTTLDELRSRLVDIVYDLDVVCEIADTERSFEPELDIEIEVEFGSAPSIPLGSLLALEFGV